MGSTPLLYWFSNKWKDSAVFEISDNVDITYRLYDFDRGRELNLKQGLETLAPLSDLEISNKSCFKGRIYVKEEKVEGRNIIEEDENFKIIIPLEGKLSIETNTDFQTLGLDKNSKQIFIKFWPHEDEKIPINRFDIRGGGTINL